MLVFCFRQHSRFVRLILDRYYNLSLSVSFRFNQDFQFGVLNPRSIHPLPRAQLQFRTSGASTRKTEIRTDLPTAKRRGRSIPPCIMNATPFEVRSVSQG
jgi:hypothetical protein